MHSDIDQRPRTNRRLLLCVERRSLTTYPAYQSSLSKHGHWLCLSQPLCTRWTPTGYLNPPYQHYHCVSQHSLVTLHRSVFITLPFRPLSLRQKHRVAQNNARIRLWTEHEVGSRDNPGYLGFGESLASTKSTWTYVRLFPSRFEACLMEDEQPGVFIKRSQKPYDLKLCAVHYLPD